MTTAANLLLAAWLNGLNAIAFLMLGFIEPCKPQQNAYIERFNRTFREDVLDAYLFDSVDEAQALAEQNNRIQPHQALTWQTPIGYALNKQKKSTFRLLLKKD